MKEGKVCYTADSQTARVGRESIARSWINCLKHLTNGCESCTKEAPEIRLIFTGNLIATICFVSAVKQKQGRHVCSQLRNGIYRVVAIGYLLGLYSS